VRDGPIGRTWAWLHGHDVLLWWLHSSWALAWGVAFMWLGSRQFAWLRVAFVYITFIWISSLFLPALADWPRLTPSQRGVVRAIVNYFNKNFYQQLLFFVLPIYGASVTWGSPNMLFVAIVGASAVFSTFDVVYDRRISARREPAAVFFAFNLFVCVNVALPVLWSISTLHAMRVSGVLALLGFATLRYQLRRLASRQVIGALLASAVVIAFFVEWGRPLVPPAPLRLVSAQFGLELDRQRLVASRPVASIPPAFDGRLYAVSAIHAPLGLRDRIRHRWIADGREVYRSPYYTVTGGRTQGFRLWTSARVRGLPAGVRLIAWVETEGGQIVGRAVVRVR
jgi:hypothetical protein